MDAPGKYWLFRDMSRVGVPVRYAGWVEPKGAAAGDAKVAVGTIPPDQTRTSATLPKNGTSPSYLVPIHTLAVEVMSGCVVERVAVVAPTVPLTKTRSTPDVKPVLV